MLVANTRPYSIGNFRNKGAAVRPTLPRQADSTSVAAEGVLLFDVGRIAVFFCQSPIFSLVLATNLATSSPSTAITTAGTEYRIVIGKGCK